MHFFTSITANYIPKARVLALSVKRYHPNATFHLVLSDERPNCLKESEPFDNIILAKDLEIPNFLPWAFKHSVVEMCTAVKGVTFQYLFKNFNAQKVFFLDPDMVVLGSLDELINRLDQASILLTPHQTVPETNQQAIIDNEIGSLKYGVFNLGFLGVRASLEGVRFIDWWTDRLLNFCYADIAGGLFTDQRWIDLAPCFFDEINVIRDPGYNVATWNLTHRIVSGSLDSLLVNGQPLRIYHFSGFDSGAQEIMLNKYGNSSPVLKELRQWYIDVCEEQGQSSVGRVPSIYQFFDNGERITQAHRVIYRWRSDLAEMFTNPYQTQDPATSYMHWFAEHGKWALKSWLQAHPAESYGREVVESDAAKLREELERVYHSRTWQVGKFIARLTRPFARS